MSGTVRILTKQQWFDNALKGVRSQDYALSSTASGCLYDSPDGKHCAVGWSLTDTDIGAKNEGTAAGTLLDRGYIGVLGTPSFDARVFITELQMCHDRLLGVPSHEVREAQFESEMQDFAARWEVVYSTPEALK